MYLGYTIIDIYLTIICSGVYANQAGFYKHMRTLCERV